MEFYGKILTCARLDFYTIQCSDVYVFILYLYNWVTYAYFISILLIGIYRLYLYICMVIELLFHWLGDIYFIFNFEPHVHV